MGVSDVIHDLDVGGRSVVMLDHIDADIIINIHRGEQGYGIYFRVHQLEIVVSGVEKGSEAEKSGVQPNDLLVSVMDHDKVYPPCNPGAVMRINRDNYYETLKMVRRMKHAQCAFRSPCGFLSQP
jgi:hypothetical protein